MANNWDGAPNPNATHPLISGDTVSSKTDEELQTIISKLAKNLSFASRTSNYGMANQIVMALNVYREEQQRRSALQWAEQESDQDLDGKIDVQ
jgi:hypothetical protein